MAASSVTDDKIVKETLRLIDQGWEELNSKCSIPAKKEVIFILGTTGGGKSTATQIVIGNLEKLHAKKHRSGLVIVDEVEEGKGRIGDPQVASKTFLPEYMTCNNDTNLVFVDCPGFNDNRGPQMDIAAMVLIQKIAKQVDHARFLFVVPSSSVSYSSINRNDFLLLATHATSFFKNLNKIKDSMGLIITKANNRDPSTGSIIEDETVIEETREFLMEASREPAFKKNQQFIEYLLSDEEKWALIRFPSELGPLNKMEHFVQVRHQIREMCTGKLKSVAVTHEDFAVTISPESKCVILKSLIPHMKAEIDRILTENLGQFETAFVAKFQSDLLDLRGEKLVASVKNLKEISNKLTHQAQDDMLPLTKKIFEAAELLQIALTDNKLAELKKAEEQLSLFQKITDEKDVDRGTAGKITTLFHSLQTNLTVLHKSTLKFLRHNNVRNVRTQKKEEADKLLREFTGKYSSEFWNSLKIGDEFGKEALDKLEVDWLKIETLEWDGHAKNEVKKIVDSAALNRIWIELGFEIQPDSCKHLKELENELEILLELIGDKGRYGDTNGILGQVSTALKNLRAEAHVKVRNEYVKLVHAKIQKLIDSLFGYLEDTYFRESFYPDLNLGTMNAKRRMLEECGKKLQDFWGSYDGMLDAVSKGFAIFDVEVKQSNETLLSKYEDLLRFYDGILGSPLSRPMNEWMTRLRSLQDRIQEMERLYEFMFLAKNSDPLSIKQDSLKGDGDIISGFLDTFRATSDIRRIVQKREYAEEKLLMYSIATYLENERGKRKPKNVAARSRVASAATSSASDSWFSERNLQSFFQMITPVVEYLVTPSNEPQVNTATGGRGNAQRVNDGTRRGRGGTSSTGSRGRGGTQGAAGVASSSSSRGGTRGTGGGGSSSGSRGRGSRGSKGSSGSRGRDQTKK